MPYYNYEDGTIDEDGADFDDSYVYKYITTRLVSCDCIPKWVKATPEEIAMVRENLPQVIQRLMDFEIQLRNIKFPLSK